MRGLLPDCLVTVVSVQWGAYTRHRGLDREANKALLLRHLRSHATTGSPMSELQQPEHFILAIVEFDGDTHRVRYLRRPFQREPDFGVTSVNYDFAELLSRAAEPA